MAKKSKADKAEKASKIQTALEKLGLTEWSEKLNSKTTEEIKKEIIACEQSLFFQNKEKIADAELQDAIENKKNLEKPYKEKANEEKTKIQFMCEILETRGTPVQ